MPRRQSPMTRSATQAPVRPAVLRWARESVGLTVEAVATRLGVSAAALVRWESEATVVSITALEKLAHIYKRPLAAFFLPSPPEEPTAPPDFRATPARRGRPLDPSTRLAIRRARRVQAVAADLADGQQIDVGKASIQDAADDAAAAARGRLGVAIDAQLEWVDTTAAANAWKAAVERLGVLVLELGFAARDARAFSLADRSPPVIVLNSRDARVAKPFSLFHEYAHLMLGDGGLCDFDDLRDGVDLQRAERFCNRFAAAVLLPRDAFRAQINRLGAREPWPDRVVDRLTRLFKVSRPVVFLRLVTLGLASSEAYRRRREDWEAERAAQPPRRGGRNVPAARCLRENGLRFTSAVLASERSGRITRRDVAEYLGVRVKYLGEVERRLSRAAPA